MKSFHEFLDESIEDKNKLLKKAVESLIDAGSKEMLINLEPREQRKKAILLLNELEKRYLNSRSFKPWEEDAYKKIAPVFKRSLEVLKQNYIQRNK